MASTPSGLFVGAANPFGPEVGMQTPAGWTYAANPKGGLEIWLGDRSHADGKGGEAGTADAASGAAALATTDDVVVAAAPEEGDTPAAEGATGQALADEATLARL